MFACARDFAFVWTGASVITCVSEQGLSPIFDEFLHIFYHLFPMKFNFHYDRNDKI